MIDLGIAVDYFSVPVQIERKEIGTYDGSGNYISVAPTVEDIRGTVQPAKGSELLDLAEGIRSEVQFIFDTRSDIANDSVVIHNGERYRIVHKWPSTLGHYNRYAIGLLA